MSLTSGAVTLSQGVPKNVVFSEKAYTSTSDLALSRRHIEIPPQNDTNYSPSGITDIVVDIASNTSFLSLQETFISGTIQFEGLDLGDALEDNGIHSLIESVELRVASTGTILERLDAYNLFTAMEDKLIFSKEEIQNNFADEWKSTDGAFPRHKPGKFFQRYTILDRTANPIVPFQITGVTFDPDDNLTVINFPPIPLDQLKALEFADVEVGGSIFPIRTLTNVSITFFGEVRLLVNDFMIFNIWEGGNNRHPLLTAQEDINTQFKFVFRPRIGFWRQKNYFPLFLLAKGLQLVIRLDPQAKYRSFIKSQAFGQAILEPSFTMSNIRMHAIMYDMHSSVAQEYVNMYTTGRGVMIPYTSYIYHSKVLSDAQTTETVELNVGVRSATAVMSRLIGSRFWSENSLTTKKARVLSEYQSTGLRSYQFHSGSIDFPLKAVNIGVDELYVLRRHQKLLTKQTMDRFNTSYLYEETPHLGLAGNDMGDMQLKAGRQVQDTTNLTDSIGRIKDFTGCIISAILTRDPYGYFSGLDTSTQPIRVELEFDRDLNQGILGYNGGNKSLLLGNQRYLQSFIAYESYAHIAQHSGVAKLS